MRMTRLVAAALPALVLAAADAGAYPIPPVTLWQLTQDANLVVLARVTRVESRAGRASDDAFERDTARLDVLEVWKGEKTGEVAVTFGKDFICPAPPRYESGRTVLAFLQSGSTMLAGLRDDVSAEQVRALTARWTGRYFTVGLSYGTLYPRDEDLPFLRDLVADALALQQSQPAAADAARRSWHVRAATRSVTRWQGLYGLQREGDALHTGYDRAVPKANPPTADERREVMRGFIEDPSADHTLVMALAFAGRQPEIEFDRAVLGQVERLLAGRDLPYWLPDAMVRAVERFGAVDGRRALRLKPAEEFEEPNPAALRTAWRKARERYGIPTGPAGAGASS